MASSEDNRPLISQPPQRLVDINHSTTTSAAANLTSQILFQDETMARFNCGPSQQAIKQRHPGDPGPKSCGDSSGGYFPNNGSSSNANATAANAEYCRSMFRDAPDQNWNNGKEQGFSPPSSDGSDEDEDDDGEEDEEDDDADEGTSRVVLIKDGNLVNNLNVGCSENNHLLGRPDHFQNAVTVADPEGDMYYSQFLHASNVPAQGKKDLGVENCCSSGRKDASFLNGSGESLRAILSDPLTGALMEDAMILPCGHSFGSGGIRHALKMKACCTCSQSISDESVQPNLSLRAAVQAFIREEELHFYRASKRRRERFEDKTNIGDSSYIDTPRGRGVQFPFVVSDRVVIKGNKRTPQRFVGREAVVTTQCLNGWYVVKTLDNAESVKLQYRSLAKIADDPSSKTMPNKVTPNWLSGIAPQSG